MPIQAQDTVMKSTEQPVETVERSLLIMQILPVKQLFVAELPVIICAMRSVQAAQKPVIIIP